MADRVSKVIGVIPARWGSTRMPGKPLRPILGKPLLHWVIERVRQAELLSDIIVATDDQRICSLAKEVDCNAVMTSDEHPSGTDRVAEAVEGTTAAAVINIQGDEPLVEPALIDRLAGALVECGTEWDMVTAAAMIEKKADIMNPNIVKVVCRKDGGALYFSRSPIPFLRDEVDLDEAEYLHHIGIYGYTRPFLERLVAADQCMLERVEKLEQLRALHIGGRIKVLETHRMGIGVDTPADVEKVEKVLRKIGRHL